VTQIVESYYILVQIAFELKGGEMDGWIDSFCEPWWGLLELTPVLRLPEGANIWGQCIFLSLFSSSAPPSNRGA
jgi:hypothetical protein